MSTPSGKPFDRVRISDYAPKIVRDRLAAGAERKSDPPERPVTPLRAPDETPFDRPRPDERFDERPAPLAPVGPHERSRNERDQRDHDGSDRIIPRAAAREETYREQDASYSEHEQPSSEADASSGHEEQAAATPSQTSAYIDHSLAYEVDLQRLESDLEALRGVAGEGAARRPAAGEAQPAREPRRARDTYIDGIRLPRSLEPSYLPPPPIRDRPNHLGMVQRIVIACAVAAPLTYFVISYFSAASDTAAKRATKTASVETQLASIPPMPEPQTREALPSPPPAQAAIPAAPAPQPAPAPALRAHPAPVAHPAPPPPPAAQAAPAAQQQPPFTLQSANPARPAPRETIGVAVAPAAPAPAPPRVAAATPVPAVAAPPPGRRPATTMNPDEVAVLLKQGEQFISTGDVVTARVLFERVAEAGNASGALALGATYDPAVLAKLGVRGIAPDVAKARVWYERARDLGSAEARGRLETLAQR